MSDIQNAKAVVRAHLARLDSAASGAETSEMLWRSLTPDHVYRGVHPFNTLSGPEALAETVYSPLKSAIGAYQRRLDMFFAGPHHNKPDGAVRVVVMGNILGFFTAPWLR